MRAKKITQLAVLTAVALVMFVVELQIPLPIPIPGIKLGLSNVITLCVLFLFGGKQALAVLLVRIVLGAAVTGRVGALPYALAGGLLSFFVMLLLRRRVTERQLWVLSVIGGLFHNLGQFIAALFITQTIALAVYLPVLLLGGMLAGLFTGLCAQPVVLRIKPPS